MTSTIHSDMPKPRLGPRAEEQEAGQTSLFAMGTTILRKRWRIMRWTLAGAVIAALLTFTSPTVYSATASFIPQGTDPGRASNLQSLAGQLGVSLPSTNQQLSPEFYVKLLKSRELLRTIVRDTLVVQEMGGRRVPFLDLFDVAGKTQTRREEVGVRMLMRNVGAASSKTTGVVDFSVTTKWPSVSVAIANALVDGLNRFNQRMRQEQAGAERKFVEGRLNIAGADLRAAEDRLEDFQRTNRQFANSPDLSFQRDRLQRDISLKQQVFTSLTQSYEEVRIREVRDTPVITLVEEPAVPNIPEASGRLWAIVLGILLGTFIGVVSALFSESINRHRRAGDAYADEFAGTLGEIKGAMFGRVQALRQKIRS
jgi:uncharacterized protein involved in exopolysaccharide biosynthesis